jgi:two-component system, chemotaxis family, chemotaxis protein CheY
MKTQSPRILFADDEPEMRRLVSIVLARGGYNVTTVADGQAAWEALETETFDLLVTDNQMPRLTGQKLVLKVREKGLKLPIIVAASQLEFFLNPDNEWLRVAQVLQKPYRLVELIVVVARILCPGHSI